MTDFERNTAYDVFNETGKWVSWTHAPDLESYAKGCGHGSLAEMRKWYPNVDRYTIKPNAVKGS